MMLMLPSDYLNQIKLYTFPR